MELFPLNLLYRQFPISQFELETSALLSTRGSLTPSTSDQTLAPADSRTYTQPTSYSHYLPSGPHISIRPPELSFQKRSIRVPLKGLVTSTLTLLRPPFTHVLVLTPKVLNTRCHVSDLVLWHLGL